MNLYVHHLKIVKLASVFPRLYIYYTHSVCVLSESCHKQEEKGKLSAPFHCRGVLLLLLFFYSCVKSRGTCTATKGASLCNYNALAKCWWSCKCCWRWLL